MSKEKVDSKTEDIGRELTSGALIFITVFTGLLLLSIIPIVIFLLIFWLSGRHEFSQDITGGLIFAGGPLAFFISLFVAGIGTIISSIILILKYVKQKKKRYLIAAGILIISIITTIKVALGFL